MRARDRTDSPDRRRGGAALLLTFLLMLGLSGLALAVGVFAHNSVVSSRVQLEGYQVPVRWRASDVSFGAGTYTVTTTDNGGGTYTITSSGYAPDATNTVARRRIREKSIPVTASGSNIALNTTATASSYSGQNTPAKAVDGDADTRWRCTTGNGCWLALDFGTNKVFTQTDYDEQGNKITGYTIEVSRDATTWEAARGLSINGDVADFDKVTARYVRIRITSVSDIEPALNEFKVYAVTSGSSMTLGDGTVVIDW
ncbi:MAG: discoidin domain-containing protein [Candidatus Omnitrophica bacterium]|nr:discoidin domain-containing protein [Candidatus Omnitrophota bacterium]